VRISVVHGAGPDVQTAIELELEEGTTVRQAIEASQLLILHPEIGPDTLAIGVFGDRVTEGTVLRDGDRVEIYRPLKADPKAARRQRAARRHRQR